MLDAGCWILDHRISPQITQMDTDAIAPSQGCPQITQIDADPSHHRTVANTKAQRREAVAKASHLKVSEAGLEGCLTLCGCALDRAVTDGQMVRYFAILVSAVRSNPVLQMPYRKPAMTHLRQSA